MGRMAFRSLLLAGSLLSATVLAQAVAGLQVIPPEQVESSDLATALLPAGTSRDLELRLTISAAGEVTAAEFEPGTGRTIHPTPRFLRIALPAPTPTARLFELVFDDDLDELGEVSLFE